MSKIDLNQVLKDRKGEDIPDGMEMLTLGNALHFAMEVHCEGDHLRPPGVVATLMKARLRMIAADKGEVEFTSDQATALKERAMKVLPLAWATAVVLAVDPTSLKDG